MYKFVLCFVLCTFAVSSFAETLTSLDQSKAGISFKLSRTSDTNFEALFTGPDLHSIDTLELHNPGRLVFDFPGVTRKIHKQFEIQENSLVSAVRVGSHPDKFRLVFDLVSEKTPFYSISAAPGKFSVRFATTKQQTARMKPSSSINTSEEKAALKPSPKSEPAKPIIISRKVPTKPAVKLTQPETKIVLGEIQNTEASLEPETLSVTETTPSLERPITTLRKELVPELSDTQLMMEVEEQTIDPRPALSKIEFTTLAPKNIPILELQFSQKNITFNLLKESEVEYLLRVKNTQMGGEHIALPYFAPKDFPGINSLQTEVKDKDLVVRLRVEPNLRLSAFQRQQSLFVRGM